MKIILLESIPNISKEQLNAWDNANDNQKEVIINKIISQYNNKSLKNILPAIKINFLQSGINPQINDFMQLLDNLTINLKPAHTEYFTQLHYLYLKDHIDITKPYFNNPSLYNRSLWDFSYTVRIYDLVVNRYKLKKYFKDTTEIKEKELFIPGSNNEIKPVQKGSKSTDTLYGLVTEWSKNNNPKDTDKTASNYFSLADAFKYFKIDYNNQNTVFKKILYLFKNYYNKLDINKNYSYDTYIGLLTDIVKTNTTKTLSPTQLDKIKIRDHARSFENDLQTDPELCEEGTVIYVNTLRHEDGPVDYNIVDGYFIYHNNDWHAYDPNQTSKAPVRKYQKLLSMKTISDLSDKESILIGIIKSLEILSKDVDEEDNDEADTSF